MAGEPRLQPLGIDGAWLVNLAAHTDERGLFAELYRAAPSVVPAGMFAPEQVSLSTSRADVVRGIHYTATPPGQAKYVTCVRGGVLDIVVDLRVGSPKFGWHVRVRLDEHQPTALLIGEGLGHGFCALHEDATLVYLCSRPYDPATERGINPLDPALKIVWPTSEPILSDRDCGAVTLDEARLAGLLPSYDGQPL